MTYEIVSNVPDIASVIDSKKVEGLEMVDIRPFVVAENQSNFLIMFKDK